MDWDGNRVFNEFRHELKFEDDESNMAALYFVLRVHGKKEKLEIK